MFTRYALGSLAAMATSELTLLLVYGLHIGGAGAAAVIAWATGAVVNYFLNRNWAWRRRGRAHPVKELLPYWLTAVASLVISTGATKLTGVLGARLTDDHTLVTLAVGASYLITFLILFVAKFYVFHYVIFAERRAPATAAPQA